MSAPIAETSPCGVCRELIELTDPAICFDTDLFRHVCRDCARELMYAATFLRFSGFPGCTKCPRPEPPAV